MTRISEVFRGFLWFVGAYSFAVIAVTIWCMKDAGVFDE